MREQDIGHGNKILGFDTKEEMEAYLESSRRRDHEALAEAVAEQNTLTYGSYVARVAGDLLIFGRIMTEDEFEDPLEWVQVQESRDEYGQIYGQWYSIACPEGEYGSAHIISCWPIPEAVFVYAKHANWVPWAELIHTLKEEISAAQARQSTP